MGSSLLTLEPCTRSWYRAALVDLRRAGISVTTTSTRRTTAEQARLFRDFQAGITRFPAARPGTSTHELGIAVDLVPLSPKALPAVILLMARHGFKWAGAHDRVHFTYQAEFSPRGSPGGLSAC